MKKLSSVVCLLLAVIILPVVAFAQMQEEWNQTETLQQATDVVEVTDDGCKMRIVTVLDEGTEYEPIERIVTQDGTAFDSYFYSDSPIEWIRISYHDRKGNVQQGWIVANTDAITGINMSVFDATSNEEYNGYEKTINIHDSLPPYTIRITDTVENTADFASNNILLVKVFSENGEQLQSFTYFSNETPEYDGVAALVMAKDLNFDGYNDLMLLTGAGARNVFHAFSLWDSHMNQFRPVEVVCNWNRETERFDPEIKQLELCNVELIPEEKSLYSSVQDGFWYRRDIYWGWESQYGITERFIWDVYDAGDRMIGESLYQFGSQVVRLWDEQYPEDWYYGQNGVFAERQKAAKAVIFGVDSLPWLQVSNVDWVNLRKQDSKASPSLAKLYAGQEVELLVDACDPENGWVRVLYHCDATGSREEFDGIFREEMTGYIWHSFLEPVQ